MMVAELQLIGTEGDRKVIYRGWEEFVYCGMTDGEVQVKNLSVLTHKIMLTDPGKEGYPEAYRINHMLSLDFKIGKEPEQVEYVCKDGFDCQGQEFVLFTARSGHYGYMKADAMETLIGGFKTADAAIGHADEAMREQRREDSVDADYGPDDDI